MDPEPGRPRRWRGRVIFVVVLVALVVGGAAGVGLGHVSSSAGQKAPEAEALTKQAREALSLVEKARAVHNPDAAEALLKVARDKADAALALSAQR